MEGWVGTTLILCLYGFFKEIRPSEPYLTEYLVGNNTGLTEEQVYQDVYPIWTYSYLGVLILVFLFTDLLKYKPVIVFEGIAYITTWSLLLWGKGLLSMQFMQFAYGVATSTEVAYFTYIYAKVSPHYYQQVTSFTRTALLLGRFLSGLLSQVLIASGVVDYRGLNYISLAMVSIAAVSSLLLPSVPTTIYFHRNKDDGGLGLVEPETVNKPLRESVMTAFRLVGKDFVKSFSNPYILKWSLWWALGTCGNFQVGNYIQPLWEEVMKSNGTSGELYNGAVEAATTLTGAALAFMFGFLHLNWSLIGEITVAIISVLDAVVLYMMAEAGSIWTAYIGYLIFRALYQMMITVASFEIASHITQESYGLVFGFNTFLALLFQTILTATVADSAGLALDIRTQFVVYAGYFAVVGVIYFLVGLASCCTDGVTRYKAEGVWIKPDRRISNSSRIDPPVGSVECPQ
ncbi:thiamine transporter 1 [Eurytemora carolleeae]|uniref:thiamine transporter 1 n=1 Tax=Eurytemora carolleeae TaxID=1294199 RepID=UPI000C768D8A|nr:thiamine transporter 1 [Eurytemora carolleeae]|eukprot:XP_023340838.1 thiamine transporter 1-like [Eurytemora affinis]